MLSNVEIKAKIKDIKSFIEKAKAIADKSEMLLKQEDTYFNVSTGRLKLRQTEGQHSQLIFYNRPDVEGPKLSSYNKQIFQNSSETEGLKEVLKVSLGVVGVVKKVRRLYMVGQTRLHVDDVDQLGHFMELEVVLETDQSVEYGQVIAEQLMSTLEISKIDLISCSYIDLLLKENAQI